MARKYVFEKYFSREALTYGTMWFKLQNCEKIHSLQLHVNIQSSIRIGRLIKEDIISAQLNEILWENLSNRFWQYVANVVGADPGSCWAITLELDGLRSKQVAIEVFQLPENFPVFMLATHSIPWF